MTSNHLAKAGEKMAEEAEKEKKKVYVETTVISDATALPSKDLVLAGRQFVSREWLESAKVRYELYSSFLVRRESLKGDPEAAARRMAAAQKFDLYSSAVVRREAMRGDPDAARRRLEALTVLVELPMTPKAEVLAQMLMERKAVPKEFPDDALHIAMATVYGMDYLVSWNFKHITNFQMIPKIKKVCA